MNGVIDNLHELSTSASFFHRGLHSRYQGGGDGCKGNSILKVPPAYSHSQNASLSLMAGALHLRLCWKGEGALGALTYPTRFLWHLEFHVVGFFGASFSVYHPAFQLKYYPASVNAWKPTGVEVAIRGGGDWGSQRSCDSSTWRTNKDCIVSICSIQSCVHESWLSSLESSLFPGAESRVESRVISLESEP